MSELHIYNTLTRSKEKFEPIKGNKVNMYVCGMTVYDFCHLGHARVMVVFDVVARWLRALGYDLTYVRNITDIDDKIIKRAAENGESIGDLTSRFIDEMNKDADALGALRPDIEPRATENIPQMLDMIQSLVDRGMAYHAPNGDVYYRVRSFPAYGQLSGKSLDDLQAGSRVEVDESKEDPLDFVLWKAAKEGEPCWDSQFGKGRPGWHIECSAMSRNIFGDVFDIHGGGSDLQFPHHENEIAQSCGATGCEGAPHPHCHVKYWMHNGFIRVNDEKMSKSLNNFSTIKDVLKVYDKEVVRFFIMKAHYRSPLNYSEENLQDAKSSLTRLYTALAHMDVPDVQIEESEKTGEGPIASFFAAMNDDLNTPLAIGSLFEMALELNKTKDPVLAGKLKKLAGLVGLLQRDPDEFLKGGSVQSSDGPDDAAIDALVEERNKARAEKNWKRSDEIRDELGAMGIILEDSPQGTTWRRK